MSSFSPVHRDRNSRPAPPRAPVHAPAHLPCCVASPITHTPVRSESARLSAPRGGCCRFVMRSAGSSRQQVCDDRLGCVGILTATGLCSWRCSLVSGAHGMPNAAWRQCDVRATATASDGMLLSGVPILAASTTGLAGVRTVDKEVGSVDARLRRRRKLAPARSNSAALSIALSVFFTAPCLSTRTCLLAEKFPPPRGPCFAIEAGLFQDLALTVRI